MLSWTLLGAATPSLPAQGSPQGGFRPGRVPRRPRQRLQDPPAHAVGVLGIDRRPRQPPSPVRVPARLPTQDRPRLPSHAHTSIPLVPRRQGRTTRRETSVGEGTGREGTARGRHRRGSNRERNPASPNLPQRQPTDQLAPRPSGLATRPTEASPTTRFAYTRR